MPMGTGQSSTIPWAVDEPEQRWRSPAFDPMGSAHLMLSAKAARRRGAVFAYGFYPAANRGSNAVRDALTQYAHCLRSWRCHRAKNKSRSTTSDLRRRITPEWFVARTPVEGRQLRSVAVWSLMRSYRE
jgi:hypothetical protein